MSERTFPSRRDFLTLAAGAFAVAAVPRALRSRSKLVRRSLPLMGTTAELAVVHRDERYAHAAMQAALAELQRVERLMTRFHADSDVGRANLRATGAPVAVSAATAVVLREAMEWAEATAGGFDPAIARLIDLWDVKHRRTPPPAGQVQRLAGRKLYRALDMGRADGQHVVAFRDGDVGLDLGGIACGYGVDRAVAVLREWGISNGFINVGGDIYALGRSEDGDAWKIGVRSPADPDRIIATLEVEDAAVATSGDYEQFFLHQGRRFHHIMDPMTAEPRVSGTRSLTIQASRAIDADAASTALFGVPAERAAAILARRTFGGRILAA